MTLARALYFICAVSSVVVANWMYTRIDTASQKAAILSLRSWHVNEFKWARIETWLLDTRGEACTWLAERDGWGLSYAVRCVGTKGSDLTFIVNPYQRAVKGSDKISMEALKSISRWSTQRGRYP